MSCLLLLTYFKDSIGMCKSLDCDIESQSMIYTYQQIQEKKFSLPYNVPQNNE